MFRAGVIALIIIFLQVTTFAASTACDWKEISPSFLKALNTQTTTFHMCQTAQDNASEKMATINCVNDRSYFVFYGNDSIYMQTTSNTRNNILTRCWREGSIGPSCEVTMAPIKCQSWDLDTY